MALFAGGTVPMAVTLASEAVFTCFLGDTKAEALLHGHSYTAHPIGMQTLQYKLHARHPPTLFVKCAI